MSYPSFSGSFDPVTRLVAHVPIKFIVGALAAAFVRLPLWGQTLPSRDFCGTAALPLNVLQNSPLRWERAIIESN
jgi:hypothetical protein